MSDAGKAAGDGGSLPVGVVAGVHRQRHLLEVVGSSDAGGGFADLLHGRQEQADEDGDDGDHHQQLDQGETSQSRPRMQRGHVLPMERSKSPHSPDQNRCR